MITIAGTFVILVFPPLEVVDRKGIQVNYKRNLVEVNPQKKEAVFALLGDGKEGEIETMRVRMIFISSCRFIATVRYLHE